jgi:phosphopantetheine adenylyltransferase
MEGAAREELQLTAHPLLQDPYGPTANDPEIQALVVSEETRAGGDAGKSSRCAMYPIVLC